MIQEDIDKIISDGKDTARERKANRIKLDETKEKIIELNRVLKKVGDRERRIVEEVKRNAAEEAKKEAKAAKERKAKRDAKAAKKEERIEKAKRLEKAVRKAEKAVVNKGVKAVRIEKAKRIEKAVRKAEKAVVNKGVRKAEKAVVVKKYSSY